MTTPKTKGQKTAEATQQFDAMVKLADMAQRQIDGFRAYVNANVAPSQYRPASITYPGVAERDMPRFDREKAMGKAREFVETYPLVSAIVQSRTDQIIGSGFRLNMMTGNEDLNDEIEGDWNDDEHGKNSLDIRAMRTWGQSMRLWDIRQFVDGDVGIHLDESRERRLYLNTIEADRIRGKKFHYLDQGVLTDKPGKSAVDLSMVDGVSIEKRGIGRPVAYFIGPRPENQMDMAAILKDGTAIKAEDFILHARFLGDRADALRGTSGLIQNFNLFQDITQILDAVVQKIKNEAFVALAFYMEQGVTGFNFGAAETTSKKPDGKTRRHVKMVPGTNLNLAPGEKAELLGLKSPNAELMPFLRFLIRIGGAAVGMPLEIMLMDVSDTNFSGGRLTLELAKRRYRVEQDAAARIASRCMLRWMDVEIREKRLKINLSDKDRKAGINPRLHRWGRPSMPYYNPQQEALAHGTMLDRYMTSLQRLLADEGELDVDDVIRDHAEVAKKLKDAGLPMIYGQVSTRISDGETENGQLTPKGAGTAQ